VTTLSDGLGPRQEPEPSPLSTIIERLNERFGTTWSEATRLHIQAVGEDLVDNPVVQREAAANTPENFAAGFDKHLTGALIGGLNQAQEFTYAVLEDAEMGAEVRQVLLALVYGKANRLPGALPHRRPARPADQGIQAPGVQVDAAHPRRLR
jgi:type I restriction enzyme R subunit